MDILWYGLKVTLVGMLVVFVGLIILIGCIKALKLVGGDKNQAALPAEPPAPVLPAAPAHVQGLPAAPMRAYTPGPLLTRKDDAFYAVVTAAVSQVMADEGVNPDGGFAIRNITPIHEPKPGPVLTKKDDALYAVLTAAIARVLESEGVNPEGGFAIREVKAL